MALQTISVLQSAISTAIKERRVLKNISALLNNNTSKPPITLNIFGKFSAGLVASRLSIWDTTLINTS